MKLFISHANADLFLAQTLRLQLSELSDDLDCLLLADDVFAGDLWEKRIRQAAKDCDGIVSIVTERYVGRPWFVAEWAAFWLQEKTWYPLLYKVELDTLFEPMRRSQAFSLTERLEIERFLTTLTDNKSIERPMNLVAAELVKAAERASNQQEAVAADGQLARLAEVLGGEGSKVARKDVEALCRAGRISEILEATRKSDNSVALRKLGAVFVQMHELDAARTVADRTPNLAERRTIGLRVLDMLQTEPANAAADDLRLHIYRSLRDPQRRDLRNGAIDRELDLSWPELSSNP